MYFKNKKEFRNSTAVTLKLNGATSSIFSSDKVLEWQTHGTVCTCIAVCCPLRTPRRDAVVWLWWTPRAAPMAVASK